MQVKVFEKEREKQWKIICGLWNKIDVSKGFPHYFFEVGYMVIRYNAEDDLKVKKYLKKYETKYSDNWEEESGAVLENKTIFAILFYLFSKLAIENRNNKKFDVFSAYERITHSAFNMMSKLFGKENSLTESKILSELAILRAMTNGYYAGKK